MEKREWVKGCVEDEEALDSKALTRYVASGARLTVL